MEKNVLNLSDQIDGDKTYYLGNLFFEELAKSDENRKNFSSLIRVTLLSHIKGKNQAEKLKKITNIGNTQYSKHIVQTIGFYILLKYNKNKVILETKQQAQDIVDFFIDEIKNYQKEQLKTLFGHIFEQVKNVSSTVITNYNGVTAINDKVKHDVHQTLSITPNNFHDIVVQRTQRSFLPVILQYLLYPKLKISGNDSIFINNIEADKKTSKSNFDIFAEIFKLRAIFSSLNELYEFFDIYMTNNNIQKIVDFYKFYNPETGQYQVSLYLVQEKKEVNYNNIFFQWFIEHKKRNKQKEYEKYSTQLKEQMETVFGINLDPKQKTRTRPNIDAPLSINDIYEELYELIEVFGNKDIENSIDVHKNSGVKQKIENHLMSISELFFDDSIFSKIYDELDNIPNNYNSLEAKDNFIDIDLLKNGISLKYCYRIGGSLDKFFTISEISFTIDENGNICMSEKFNEIITDILYYIDGYLNVKIPEQERELLKHLILNGIIRILVGVNSIKDKNQKISYILNSFNFEEKKGIKEKDNENNFFPLRNIKHQLDIRSLEDLMLSEKEELTIGGIKIDSNNFIDSKKQGSIAEIIKYVKDNKLLVAKNAFIEYIKGGSIKTLGGLCQLIESNKKTLELLKQDEELHKEVVIEINNFINGLYEGNWNIKLGGNYVIVIKNIFRLYDYSKSYNFDISKKDIKSIFNKMDILLVTRYLGIVKMEKSDTYNLLVEYLNEDVDYKVKKLLNQKQYFEEKLDDTNFTNITDRLEIIIETLLLLYGVLNEENKNKFRRAAKKYFTEYYIQYFSRALISINPNKYVDNENDKSKEHEFYHMFYAIKRLIFYVANETKIEGINFSFFENDSRLKDYDYQKEPKRQRLKNRNKDLKESDKTDESADSHNDLKDIYTTIDKNLDIVTTKINICKTINKLGKNSTTKDLEKFLRENKNMFDTLGNAKAKFELLLLLLNKIKLIKEDIFSSEIICTFLYNSYKMVEKYYIKNYMLNFYSNLGFFDYVYMRETNNRVEISEKNIVLIERILAENNTSDENESIYDSIKNHMLHQSRAAHNRELQQF